MTGIAIYVEGGGDTAQQKSELRQGIDGLLQSLKTKARERKWSWKVVPCGGRDQAYRMFMHALRINHGVINLLLVDSESEIAACASDPIDDAKTRVAHLKSRDNKWNLLKVHPECVHLMVCCMETWIIADAETLQNFYGKGFKPDALPTRHNLEEESKQDITTKLVMATKGTQKGQYNKIKHASQLLQKIDPAKVAHRCGRFALFVDWLEKVLDGAGPA